MIIRKQFEISQWKHKLWGILYVPDGITSKMPLVFFCHGKGENGTTESDTDKLYLNGPLNFIKSGWKPSFMVLAIQNTEWSPSPDHINYALSDVDIVSRWDGTGIITGLSAGGATVISFPDVYKDKYPGFTYVPMSPAGNGIINNLPVKLWAFSGDSDGGYTDNAKKVVSLTKGRLTIYKGGHCCWNTYYNPTYKEDINGIKMNIYEWGIQPAIVNPSPNPSPEPIVKTIKKITIEYNTGEIEVINK